MSTPTIGVAEQLAPYRNKEPAGYIVAQGQEAKHPFGVVYRGPWETYADGFSEHTRRSARALATAGIPVHLRSLSPKHRSPVGDDKLIDVQYADLLNASIRSYAAQIHQTVVPDGSLVNLLMHRHYSVEQRRYLNARKIIYTVWERATGVNPEDVKAFNLVGQAWVGCEASAQLLIGAGVSEEKVRVVPCPYFPGDPHLALAGRTRKPGPPCFYHIGKWEPRKEQRNILGAFLMAFQPGEAYLILKTNERSPFFDGYPTGPEVALSEWLADDRVKKMGWTEKNLNRGICLLNRFLTTEKMIELHAVGDVYVTLSRGEGMDMPAMDSKLAGNMMVYTPSGGPQAFASVEDIKVPSSGTVPCHPFYRWPSDATYLDYDMEAAVLALRAAAEVVKTRQPALPEQCIDSTSFSAECVGRKMAGYVRELVNI